MTFFYKKVTTCYFFVLKSEKLLLVRIKNDHQFFSSTEPTVPGSLTNKLKYFRFWCKISQSYYNVGKNSLPGVLDPEWTSNKSKVDLFKYAKCSHLLAEKNPHIFLRHCPLIYLDSPGYHQNLIKNVLAEEIKKKKNLNKSAKS